jgi:hypothetical protein
VPPYMPMSNNDGWKMAVNGVGIPPVPKPGMGHCFVWIQDRDGNRRVCVRVEPSHTRTRHFHSYPSPIPIPINGYKFFPYSSPGKVNGYPWVKIPAPRASLPEPVKVQTEKLKFNLPKTCLRVVNQLAQTDL